MDSNGFRSVAISDYLGKSFDELDLWAKVFASQMQGHYSIFFAENNIFRSFC